MRYTVFSAFVTAEWPRGLDTNVRTLRRLIADDPTALNLLERAVQNPVGTNQHSQGGMIHSTLTPAGTRDRADQQRRRLREQHPEVYSDVLAGQLTVNRAAVSAGIRPKRISVNVTSPHSVATTLRKNMQPNDFNELLKYVVTDDLTRAAAQLHARMDRDDLGRFIDLLLAYYGDPDGAAPSITAGRVPRRDPDGTRAPDAPWSE
jgi:hypothetical protein